MPAFEPAFPAQAVPYPCPHPAPPIPASEASVQPLLP
jgi:hypothetical protein